MNIWSKVTSIILCSNLLVFHTKHLNAVIACPKGMKKYLMEPWGLKKSDCLTHSWQREGGLYVPLRLDHAILFNFLFHTRLPSVFIVNQDPLAEMFSDRGDSQNMI